MLNIKKSLKKANLIFTFLVVHACASSAFTAPALTGIMLSTTVWNAATDTTNTTVKVSPQPAVAALPVCTANSTNLLTVGPASATEAQFIINPVAVTENTTVTIVCGGKMASLVLQPAVLPAQIKDLFYRTNSDGNMNIYFQLARSTSEIIGKTKTSFWVAAQVSATFSPFYYEDSWFFLTPDGWSTLITSSPQSVAYKINQIPEKATYFTIPTETPEADFRYLNIKIYFGYMDDDGIFKNMGVIWDGTQ